MKASHNLFKIIGILLLAGSFISLSADNEFAALLENQKKHQKVLADFVTLMKSSKQVDMKVEKTSVQSLLDRTTKNYGEISMTTDGRFWWKINKPQKSLLVFDGKFAWNEEKLPEDFGGGYKVAKSEQFKNSPAYRILRVLMGEGEINEIFSPLRTSIENSQTILELTPIEKNWNLSLVVLKISKDGKRLTEIEYVDDLENETSLKFSDQATKAKIDKSKFNYKPPEGAQVTEL